MERTAAAFAALIASAGIGLAQEEGVTLRVVESVEHGAYLADGDGRAVYLFTADKQAEEASRGPIACDHFCLEEWPAVYSDAPPRLGEGVDPDLVGAVEHDGRPVVTYGGWPLYLFYRDANEGRTLGQFKDSWGGVWHLVAPDGSPVWQ